MDWKIRKWCFPDSGIRNGLYIDLFKSISEWNLHIRWFHRLSGRSGKPRAGQWLSIWRACRISFLVCQLADPLSGMYCGGNACHEGKCVSGFQNTGHADCGSFTYSDACVFSKGCLDLCTVSYKYRLSWSVLLYVEWSSLYSFFVWLRSCACTDSEGGPSRGEVVCSAGHYGDMQLPDQIFRNLCMDCYRGIHLCIIMEIL